MYFPSPTRHLRSLLGKSLCNLALYNWDVWGWGGWWKLVSLTMEVKWLGLQPLEQLKRKCCCCFVAGSVPAKGLWLGVCPSSLVLEGKGSILDPGILSLFHHNLVLGNWEERGKPQRYKEGCVSILKWPGHANVCGISNHMDLSG